MTEPTNFDRALAGFDVAAFAKRHRGSKESPSPRSFEWLFTCPREGCGSSRLRFNSRKGTFICWGCGMTGSTVFLVQIMERLTELGAMEYIARGYVGGDARLDRLEDLIAPQQNTPSEALGASLRRLPPIPWPDGVERLATPCAPHWVAWDYLTRVRGLTAEQIRTWGLGFGRHGRLANYIVFPCYIDHALVYWQGRAAWDPPAHLDAEGKKQWRKATKYRKTLNPFAREGSDHASAAEVIMNYDRASVCEHVVICEGPIDAMKVGPHAIALLGKGGAKGEASVKIERIARMRARRFTVYLDRGAEEREHAEHIARELEPFAAVFIATPPEGHDPGSLTPTQNEAIIRAAEPYKTHLLSSSL